MRRGGLTGAGSVAVPAAGRPVNEPSGAWGSEGGGGGLAGCPAELARGSLAANKAALMAACCYTKAERSDSFAPCPEKDLE